MICNRMITSLMIVMMLGGCQGARVYKPDPLQATTSIALGVSEIEIVTDINADQDQSASLVNPPLLDQVKAWFQRRFQATGGEKKGYVVLRQVGFKETPLPKETGLTANFSKQPSEQYDVRLDVAFEIRDEMGFAQQSASAQVQRATSVLEGVTLLEREALVQKAINQVLTDLDAELLRNMKASLPLLLQGSPVFSVDSSNSSELSFHP